MQGPQLNIDVPDLNYGLVRLGEAIEKDIPIYNTSSVAAQWEIIECMETDQKAIVAKDQAEFLFSPCNGELQPNSSINIKALFKPNFCRRLRTVFELHAINGNKTYEILSVI